MRTRKHLLLIFFIALFSSFVLFHPQDSFAQTLKLLDSPTTDGFRIDYNGLQPGQWCYGFQLKNTTTQQIIQGPRGGCGVFGIGIDVPVGMYKASDNFGTGGDIQVSGIPAGSYEVKLSLLSCGNEGKNCTWGETPANKLTVNVVQGSNPPACKEGDPDCKCTPDMTGKMDCVKNTPTPLPQPTVNQTPAPPPCSTNFAKCPTAFGNLNISDPTEFLKALYSIILLIAGISAVGLIIYSGYILMVTGGDKTQVQKAREIITSAILGLLFIIFAIAIMEFIGISVLKIPGFEFN